jgi:hypothetical protein
MSDPVTTPAPIAAPEPVASVAAPPVQAAPVTAPAPVAAPVVATPAPAPAEPQADPAWLNPRLEQAKRAERDRILAELGVKDPAQAKAILDAAKAAEEAQKTELQKAREEAASLKARAERATVLEQTIKGRADAELASLTDAQRAAVAAVAGDDSARVLSTIDALKPTWAVAAPVVAPAPAAQPAPAAPVAAPPVSTSPAPTAPSGNAPASPPDRKAEYLALKAKNPIKAALFLNQHTNEIYPRA